MRRLVELLLLFSVFPETRHLIPPWNFVFLDTSDNGGAINLSDWTWVSDMPSNDYCLSMWINADPTLAEGNDIIYLELGSQYTSFYISTGYFSSTGDLAVFTGSQPALGYGVWFHFVLASLGATLCQIITLKNGVQKSDCTGSVFSITTSFSIIAPHYAQDGFKVRAT